ncbi:hypothetical protein ACWDUL_20730 [Nocardia niigatensis]
MRTPEQMAAYVLAQDVWSGKPRLPFGPLIVVTAAAGHRPDWAVDDPIRAAGALFAHQSDPAARTHVEWRVVGEAAYQPRSFFRARQKTCTDVLARGTLFGWITPVWLDHESNSGTCQRVSMVSAAGASLTLDVPTSQGSQIVVDIRPTSFSGATAAILNGFNTGSSFAGNPRELGRALCQRLDIEWK